MKDFTIKVYRDFLDTALQNGYHLTTFKDSLTREPKVEKMIILRHDVDKRPECSLQFAKIQNSAGIKGTYYFRIVPGSFDIEILKQIAEYGHEIGYHYETLDTSNGDAELAYKEFCINLEKLRGLTSIETISMHGSPLSPHDNRKIWEKYDYRQLGIIGEPYFDLDINKYFYLTDTGRKWDGNDVSVRDKFTSIDERAVVKYHSTQEIIQAIRQGTFPKMLMMTFHPQRWSDSLIPWYKELIFQGLKNQVKKAIVKKNKLSLLPG